jgi:Na+/H+ antiporter NhaD/arsenite permease-like protein
MDSTTIIFLLIYLLTILISTTELAPMSLAALTGALLTAWFGIQYGAFTYDEVLGFVDIRLLLLIIGTMVVVEIAERSGLFRVAALYAIKLSGGSPGMLFVFLCIASAVVSMFLSDPTAMLLMAAAIATITKLLNYDPVPYFLSATIMINLGGTSTLIGSVSNMIIGMESGMSFTEFLIYLAPCEISLWILTIITLYFLFKSRLGDKKPLPEYDPLETVTDKKLFYKSLFILLLLIFLFLTLERLEIGPEGVALGCAIIALALTKIDPAEIFKELDWETLFFIAGFMFIVSGLEKTKIINDFSVQLFQLAGQNSFNASILTLFFTGLASMVISNVAVALTFTPIINSQVFQGINSIPIWSALVLGTNLGGAATPFSGTVCVMAIGALKREGISVNFKEFTKIGLATTVIQLAFSALYLVVRFKLIGV